MRGKKEVLNHIKECGIVAVIRAENKIRAKKIAEAVYQGGIDNIEITMTVPGAVDLIRELDEEYGDSMLLGAGSVLDKESTSMVIQAGAEFVVSPVLKEGMIVAGNRYQVPVVPGAMTPTEVTRAMEAGAEVVKVFPASLFGPKIVKAISGPLPQANLLPTGGVNLDNVQNWIRSGSFAVGVGGAITGKAEGEDLSEVTKVSEKFVQKIEMAK